jgi:D-xylose transport system ATP-binding protein
MGEGRLRGDFPNTGLSQEKILAAALGKQDQVAA